MKQAGSENSRAGQTHDFSKLWGQGAEFQAPATSNGDIKPRPLPPIGRRTGRNVSGESEVTTPAA